MRKFKKLLALFSLVVFLFPLVEKEIHSISHSNDFHCDSKQFHYHPEEHHCNVCDYTNDITGLPSLSNHQLQTEELVVFNFSADVFKPQLKQPYFFSLRAPPSLV